MVRNDKRKTGERKWTEEDLKEAVTALREKRLRVKDAAARYNISCATLYRYLKRSTWKAASCSDNSKPPLAFHNKRLLNPLEEGALLHAVLDLRSSGTHIGAKEVRQICFEYVVKNNIPNKFCTRQRLASSGWYSGFCKRHPDVLSTDRKAPQELCLETPAAGSKLLFQQDSNTNSQGSSKDANPRKNSHQEQETTNTDSFKQQDHNIYNEGAVLNSSAEVQGKNCNNNEAVAAASLLELNTAATLSTLTGRVLRDRKRPYLAESSEITNKPKVLKTAESFCLSNSLFEIIIGLIVSVINLVVLLWKYKSTNN